MKRILCIAVLIFMSLTGCSYGKTQLSDNTYINNLYSDKNMITLNNSKYDVEDKSKTMTAKEYGIGITVTETLQQFIIDKKVSGTVSPYFVRTSYITESSNNIFSILKANEKNFTVEEQQEYIDSAQQSVFDIFGVFCKPENNTQAEYYYTIFAGIYENIEVLGTYEGNTYYFGYNTDYSEKILTENEVKDINKIVDEINDYRNGVAIFPPVIETE